MSEQNESKPAQKHRQPRQWARGVFVVLLILAVTGIYYFQRKDPKLAGWSHELPAALRRAEQQDGKVVVLVTRSAMGTADRELIEQTLNRPRTSGTVLDYLDWPCVHLTLPEDERALAEYDVQTTPTLLLLDPDGTAVRKNVGFMTDLEFCNDFLGVSVSEVEQKTQQG